MKKYFLLVTLVLFNFINAKQLKELVKVDINKDFNIGIKTNVVIIINSKDDLKLTNSFKKDLLVYLNKKYKSYNFSFESKSSDFKIEINLNDISITHFNTPGTQFNIQTGQPVVVKGVPGKKTIEVIENNAVLSNSIIIFNSEIKYNNVSSQNVIKSNYLVSADGINKNSRFISTNEIYNNIDYDFIDFVKQDNYINTQEVGFTKGLNGSSGFSENNINISNRNNDYKARSIIFALLLKDIDLVIKSVES